jgi:hypothetical protein
MLVLLSAYRKLNNKLMQQMRNISFFSILSAIVMTGCTSDADIIPPVMEISDLSSAVTTGEICGNLSDDVITLTGGQTFTFRLALSDDAALSQYKIDIHHNFDCHGHGGALSPSVNPPATAGQTTDWSVLRVISLKGNSTKEDISLPIPQNVTAGQYHFSLKCIDAAGNESLNNKIFSVRMYNPEDTIVPEIDILSPQTNEINAKKGEKITFTGKLSDNRPLGAGGNGMVFISYINTSSGNSFTTNSYRIMGPEASSTENFSLEFMVPQTFSSGKYIFYVGALDGVRNQSPSHRFDIAVQ